MPYPSITKASESLTLEPLKVASRTRIGAQVLDDAVLSTMQDHVLGGLVATLESQVFAVAAQSATQRVIHEEPATWWDHLKRDAQSWAIDAIVWQPQPLIRSWFRTKAARLVRRYVVRHPIRYDAKVTTVRLTNYLTFPENDRVFPRELGTPVPYTSVSTDTEDWA